jgi:cytochrome P450
MITAINPQAHARMRRTLAPAFSERALKAQEPIVSRYVNLLVEKLREPVQANGGSAVVDVFPFLNYATFDIFGDLGFGESFSCLETGGYHPWIKLIFDNVKFLGFVNGMKYFPTFEWLLKKCIPPSLKKMQQDHHQHIVDKVRRRMNWEASREDIMSHTLKESKGGSGKGMSQQEIEFTFSGLAVAASETTATALAGILNLLSAAPKERDILAEEVHSALSQAPDITPSGLVDLPYLNAVIEEGLRLCPPIPWVLPRRVPPGGDNLCGVWLPGGTAVSISQYAMNRDPFLFHDVAAFHPERWLPEGKVSTSPFCKDRRDCLQPFSVGPRSCIGKKTAYAEMRLILAKILWEFDIEERVGGAIDWASLRTFLLVEKLPIEVKLSLRAHK